MVGDISPDAARELVERHFTGWNGSSSGLVASPPASAAQEERGVWIVPRADASQSEVRIGQLSIHRAHPDYFAVLLMNAVLGGLFSSRINLNLREAHGYTYGATSYIDWRRTNSPFVVSTAVQSQVTADAVRETFHEVNRMREERISEDELSLATSYLGGVFPIRYETTAAIAAAIATLVAYDLPTDYYDTYRGRIRSVSVENVLDAARKHLAPERMQIVIVGDPATVISPLERLEIGPVRTYGG
jgi:zinc protease